jgi:hypothetical protein
MSLRGTDTLCRPEHQRRYFTNGIIPKVRSALGFLARELLCKPLSYRSTTIATANSHVSKSNLSEVAFGVPNCRPRGLRVRA